MSFLSASGSTGGSGRLVPTAPSNATITALSGTANGGTPVYRVSFTPSTTVPKTTVTQYTASFYYVVSTTEFLRGSCAITNGGDTTGSFLVTGPHYVRITANSGNGSSAQSSNSATVTALTKPADMGTITGSLSGGNISFTWNNVNAGGHNEVTYSVLLQQSTDGGVTWPGTPAGGASTTTSASYSFNASSFTSGLFRANITPTTPGGAGASAVSNSVTYTVAPPPPPPPFFPGFGPFFPGFGPFFPGFGPYFGFYSISSNTKIRTTNGLVLANQLQVGDELVSVVLPGLPEDGWTAQDVVNWYVENPDFDLSNTVTTTVAEIVHTTTDKIVYINGDAFSGSHRIMVNRDNVARMITALDIVETDLVWSATDATWVPITSIDSFESEHDVYSINCEPYDIFFTENMLVHDTRPNMPTE